MKVLPSRKSGFLFLDSLEKQGSLKILKTTKHKGNKNYTKSVDIVLKITAYDLLTEKNPNQTG